MLRSFAPVSVDFFIRYFIISKPDLFNGSTELAVAISGLQLQIFNHHPSLLWWLPSTFRLSWVVYIRVSQSEKKQVYFADATQ